MTKTVLVIEDNLDNLDIVRLVLRAAGYNVLEAVDGISGLQLARQEKPDLIVLDMKLPGLDGWAVARELRADNQLRHIPVVAVSGYSSASDRLRAAEAGCDDFVEKPIDLHNFPNLVGSYLNGSPSADGSLTVN